jgi:hypothetical protein
VKRAFARIARRSDGIKRGVSSVFKMKKQLFNELVESIKEAGQIHRGEIRASREFVFDAQDVVVEALHNSESDRPGD